MSKGKEYLRVGKIIGAHGLHGRLRIIVISDLRERFEEKSIIYLDIHGEYRAYKSLGLVGIQTKSSLLELDGIIDRDAALNLKGCEIYIDKKEAEGTRGNLAPELYYYYDIIGCTVFWKGNHYAEVVDIIRAGEGDVLVIKNNDNKELLIPFVESMIDTERIFEGRIDINPIDGLFEI
ncbi:MAG: ribosome maturation factor RimM [Spirochaetota bacterium]|nr:ribosome maturation factor RimM [Spirochaetota bacterium]